MSLARPLEVTEQAAYTEVCVVGGGPAGAALACRLAALGHRVTVVERMAFPRPHVGESISPGVWELLDILEVRTAVEQAGFTHAVQARVWWSGAPTRRLRTARPGITVDRGRFDELLLARARDAGATILQPAIAARPVRVARGWELELRTPSGTRALHARFLADASGRRGFLGGRRLRTSPRTLALYGSWSGVENDGCQTRVEARPDHWLWGAHLPSGAFSAMAFVEPELVRPGQGGLERGRGLERLYRELLARSRLFAELVAGRARLEASVRACDATCYAAANPIDTASVRVGEAAFAIDPLSSSGVQTAIQMGAAAATAVRTILAEDGDTGAAMAYFEAHHRHAVERHAVLAMRSYGDCEAYAAQPFWHRRAGPAPGSAAERATPPAPLASLLSERVRLPRRSALVPTPCVVGDRVELRRALSHPALPRPIAYLGGSELAPLLDRLTADRPLREVIEDWAESMPASAAYSIADWLADRGLLETVAPSS